MVRQQVDGQEDAGNPAAVLGLAWQPHVAGLMETALFAGLMVIPQPGQFSRWDYSVATPLLLRYLLGMDCRTVTATATEPGAAWSQQAACWLGIVDGTGQAGL